MACLREAGRGFFEASAWIGAGSDRPGWEGARDWEAEWGGGGWKGVIAMPSATRVVHRGITRR
jgi:hypothetical protein